MTDPLPNLPIVFDAETAKFEAEVIDASFDTPILINFWSPRSPTSATLDPLLEKVVSSFHGSVRLARVDVDKETQVGAMFQIQSIPTVVLMSQGQPVDGFAGPLPEDQLIEFLTRHAQPATAPEIANTQAAVVEETAEAAVTRLQALVTAEPDRAEHRLDLAVALMKSGASDDAATQLETLPANLETDDRAVRLRAQLEFAKLAAGEASVAELRSRIEKDERDFEARDQLGGRLVASGEAEAGLDQFLAILKADRQWSDGLAKKRLIAAFAIIDDADVVGSCRRKMSSLLF
ncbi:MAG: tetratricopeptide repeat protein [Dokdonella sp.]